MSCMGRSSSMKKPLNNHTNLECFLDCVTPRVPSQHLPKSCIRDLNSLWNPQSKEMVEYFTLGDLWDCFDEWSAYGTGAPVVLNNGESVVQYYVPYLSAIQIYTSKSLASSPSSSTTRSPREESSDHAEFETDSWSDDSDGEKLSRSFSSNNSSKFWDAVSDDSNFDHHESSWPMRDRLGFLYHQYFEMSAPYWRVPLMEKVTEMSRTYPGLKTLRSVDLSPASWMAVAWYPIYHIPTGRTVKDLSACFLTFHTLSSSFQDPLPDDEENDMSSDCVKGRNSKSGIPLPPFGLATYKMNGDVWIQPDAGDYERIDTLQSAADSWLKQLRVQHHDFSYFVSRSTCYAM
ncbi:hypothetical protein MKW98_027687 [Papaver atlanticum]|uniref:Plant/F9H3-4 protein n=1 Tax=Papaver atlanticum TaxID=357466 RepID=A0AAD4XV61_9MAGN|nr:hypothetical protein MKW98_027687 [Papaver atlanticum]